MCVTHRWVEYYAYLTVQRSTMEYTYYRLIYTSVYLF